MRNILIVGGGYAGFYTAWKLEKKLRRGEAKVTVIDPRPYMTYQPFLPEVMAGSIEPRHAVVPLRLHLRRTEVVTGSVTSMNHASGDHCLPAGRCGVQPELRHHRCYGRCCHANLFYCGRGRIS